MNINQQKIQKENFGVSQMKDRSYRKSTSFLSPLQWLAIFLLLHPPRAVMIHLFQEQEICWKEYVGVPLQIEIYTYKV